MSTKQMFEQHAKLRSELEERLFKIIEVYDSVDETEGRFQTFLLDTYSTVSWNFRDDCVVAEFEYIDSYDGFDQHETVCIPHEWFELSEEQLKEACKKDIECRAELEHRSFIRRLERDARENGYMLAHVSCEK
jgi:hypothetical protein